MAGVSDLVIAVVGAGAMGRITIRDLMETAPHGTTVVACDVNRRRLREIARENDDVGEGRVRLKTVTLDARDIAGTARLFTRIDAFGVINAAQHDFNLAIMDAALRARAHYCDLGGLFHITRKQVVHNRAWKKADRLALLGIGAAPGIVNVLARSAADTMEEVREIHICVAGADPDGDAPDRLLAVSYSIQTVIQEATQDAAVFARGRMTFVAPMSGDSDMVFPEPVGLARPARTIHSEVATLPPSVQGEGAARMQLQDCVPCRSRPSAGLPPLGGSALGSACPRWRRDGRPARRADGGAPRAAACGGTAARRPVPRSSARSSAVFAAAGRSRRSWTATRRPSWSGASAPTSTPGARRRSSCRCWLAARSSIEDA